MGFRHAEDAKGITSPLLLFGIALLAILAIAGFYLGGELDAPMQQNETTNRAVTNTIPFDFDGGIPAVTTSLSTPFNYSAGGVNARFSSPDAPGAFSVQSLAASNITLSAFSGNHLYNSQMERQVLVIEFNRSVTSISITFATKEQHSGSGIDPSTLSLSAYMRSTSLLLVGTISSSGTWPADSSDYPQGIIHFNSGGEPFNMVRLELPLIGSAMARNFFMDNIMVTPS